MTFTTIIDPPSLAARLGNANLLIVDCRFDLTDPARGARDYADQHIPGAVYADLNRDLSDLSKSDLGRHPLPDAAHFAAVLGRWGWTPQTQVVAYDDAGGALAAARLWWMLRLTGAHKVAVLDGGMSAWTAAGLPLDGHAVRRAPSVVDAAFAADQIVYTAQLKALQAQAAACILDARAAPRFRGDVEPIDAVAGHIPGARNRPFSDNLQADGSFKSSATLRDEFHALIGDRSAGTVIHNCGSGVTACHNLLAMEHAGLGGSRIYAPSWSGWIIDPQNPVERG